MPQRENRMSHGNWKWVYMWIVSDNLFLVLSIMNLETNMYCAFCKHPRDGNMITKYISCSMEEWYYWEHELEDCDFTIDIECSNCKKLLYSKNITLTV